MDDVTQSATSLIDLLANTVIFRHTAPYIPIGGLVATAATCRALRDLINSEVDVWRYLNLTTIRSAYIDSSPIDVGGTSWRAERMDEALTEDDFYAGPLRGIFSKLQRRQSLKYVQTLVLDGLSVPADLVRDILAEDRFSVKTLSIRGVRHLNQGKLQQVLRYIVRPTRQEGTPKLKALYFFGMIQASGCTATNSARGNVSCHTSGVTTSEGAQIGAELIGHSATELTPRCCDEEMRWYGSTGRVQKQPQSDWPDTIRACQGLITFDAVLCRGPRHDITKVDSKDFLQPTVATVALGPHGCKTCHSCPEGVACFSSTPDHTLPLLGPPPLHASTSRAAQRPDDVSDHMKYPKLILRCEDCLRGRWCERCNRWWCEACYSEPVSRVHPRTAQSQQVQLRENVHQNGWDTTLDQHGARTGGTPVKVYSKLCIERCLVSEMMSGAGSNGMWG